MIKEKKSGKLIARITTPQASHLENRVKTEKKTVSEIIRELIEQDKKISQYPPVKKEGLSLKKVRVLNVLNHQD